VYFQHLQDLLQLVDVFLQKAFHPSGRSFIAGGYDGELRSLDIPESCLDKSGDSLSEWEPLCLDISSSKQLFAPRKIHSTRIGNLFFVSCQLHSHLTLQIALVLLGNTYCPKVLMGEYHIGIIQH
jgi:hypothetical protein